MAQIGYVFNNNKIKIMITINEPKIIANEQNIKFENILIQKDKNREGSYDLIAIIKFGVWNENNERIDEKIIVYSGEDYNTFWSNFNTGKFLYDELKVKENLNVDIPLEVENDFVNP